MTKKEEKADDIERIVMSSNTSPESAKAKKGLEQVAHLISTNYDEFLKRTKPFSL